MSQQRLDHAELVADLGAAEHGDERALRVVAQAEQHLDLLLQQQPHRRRQRLRRPDDRGVGAVRRRRTRRRRRRRCRRPAAATNCRVVALLARVEAQVLQQLDAGRQLGEPCPHRRPSSTSGSACPSAGRGGWRTTTWRRGSVSHSIVGSAARMRKSSVITPVVERDVEVGAHEHPLAADVAEVVERGDARLISFLRSATLPPAYSVVSTRRLE